MISPQPHPVIACTATLAAALKDVVDVDPVFMSTAAKRQALLALDRASSQLAELRLRVLAAADDVAADDGARDAGAWLAHHTRGDRGECHRDLGLARALEARWTAVAAALRGGAANPAQADVIVRALDALPDDLDPEILSVAEHRLVAEAAAFGPRQLRVLGRRILDVIAPEIAEEQERRALEREEAHAARATYLRTRQLGDGTTEVRMRVADPVADRLLTYLDAFTAPRNQGSLPASDDRRPHDRQLGQAFGAFLEAVDPKRLPLHGGDATTVIVNVDLDDLLSGLGVALVGDTPITAGEARRLACNATLIPAVLGGDSEILDLGRGSRLFRRPQRKAMAIRDVTCRAEGCEIPAAWCEAHHAGKAWAGGGQTDLADGVLLCPFHHHRAHDHRYESKRLGNGRWRFHRRP